jgi:Caspase domain
MRRLVVVLLALSLAAEARAQTPESAPYATFALIVGVNRSVDPDVKVLRYADDDAARYLDLFRALGARSYVVTRVDANTGRLHPQVAAEALLPLRSELERATAALAADVAQAHQRGVKTVLYFAYAGHGNVKDGRGYLALEDSRLDAAELEAQLISRIHADQTHLIVDACYSYFLTLERGPGGSRREMHGFAQLGGLASRESVGLLLSTSSARESHEWSGVDSGVFSHEVRSGLHGAADVDGDGRVSYREIAAFVNRANGAIANERYRPDVFAHPPKGSDLLVDLRQSARSRIEVPASLGGHYYLEDSRGVRYADLHNGAQNAYLFRPANAGRLYLRRVEDDREFVIPSGPEIVSLATLTPQEARNRSRGSANDAFEMLFSQPFDARIVQEFALVGADAPDPEPARPLSRRRLYAGLGLVGAATAAAIGASATLISAHDLRANANRAGGADAATESRIASRRTWSAVGFGFAGLAAASGLAVLLWPSEPVQLGVGPGLAAVSVRGSF